MGLPAFNFTTGDAALPAAVAPATALLSYNGCTFSPLFATDVSGIVVKDEANRTTKYMEYVITVDGYVTLHAAQLSIADTMATLRRALTAQGGELTYQGRGCDIIVNAGAAAGNRNDVAWGPIPEILDFQPLGGASSAKIVWRVTVRIPEVSPRVAGPGEKPGGLAGGLLQFNYETSVGYGEDGYSILSIRGVLEIPLTRTPNQRVRTLTQTADNFRDQIEARLMKGIDLTRFRVVRRNFSLSRDKRILTWDFSIEEKAYMDLPPHITVARGTYTVRPSKAGMGLVTWLCSLRATYTVRHDSPRRIAWLAYLQLLRVRMAASRLGPELRLKGEQNPGRGVLTAAATIAPAGIAFATGAALLQFMRNLLNMQDKIVKDSNRPLLVDFSVDEGLYLDSKTTTFSATWKIVVPFSHVLLASGIWTKVAEQDAARNNLWAASMKDIQGHKSWELNRANPALDVIVDFGS